MASGTNSKKRFTDIHIWDQPWFIELSKDQKLFWNYMNDKCDNIGLYAHSERKANFDTQTNIKASEIESIFNLVEPKVKEIDGKFLLIDFCKFQHCSNSPLLPKARVFVSYMKDIKDAGLIEYFHSNQPEVVSDDAYIFFRAFQDGILDFKHYSDNHTKNSGALTPYQEALQIAKEHYSLSHSNDIPMALITHQGKGKGAGKGRGKEEGTGEDQGKGTPFSNSKRIAEQLFRDNSTPVHTLTKKVQGLAETLFEAGIEDSHTVIENTLESLKEYSVTMDLTIDRLIEEVSDTYLSE